MKKIFQSVMFCAKYILLYKMSFLFLFSRERLLFSRTIFSVYYKYGTEDITYWFGNPHVHKYHIYVASFTVECRYWNKLTWFSIKQIFIPDTTSMVNKVPNDLSKSWTENIIWRSNISFILKIFLIQPKTRYYISHLLPCTCIAYISFGRQYRDLF